MKKAFFFGIEIITNSIKGVFLSTLKWYVKEKDGSPGLGSIGHAKWVLAFVSVHFWQHSSVLNYPQKYCSEVVVGCKACVLSHHNYYCICSCICFDNSLTMIQIWIDDLSWMHLRSTRSEYSQLILLLSSWYTVSLFLSEQVFQTGRALVGKIAYYVCSVH